MNSFSRGRFLGLGAALAGSALVVSPWRQAPAAAFSGPGPLGPLGARSQLGGPRELGITYEIEGPFRQMRRGRGKPGGGA